MTRDEHIAWCKERAMAELNYYGDNPDGFRNAVVSMLSDLRKHPETENHGGGVLGVSLLAAGFMNNRKDVVEWIEGFR